MSEKQNQSQPQGKWAAEVYDFLKLFSRVGGTITGLVLAEAGWAILLGITATLAGKDNLPVLGVPWPPNGWQTRDVRLTTLYPLGALLIGVFWVFFSNLYLYIWRPLIKISRFCFNLLLQIAYVLLMLIAFVFSLLLFPWTLLLEWRWKRKQPKDYVARLHKIKQEDLNAYYREIYRQTKFNPFWLPETITDVFVSIIRALNSTGRLGLAPIHSHSAEEDFKAAKIPSQLFAGAVNRLCSRFSHLPAFNRISFEVLPAIPQVNTIQRARRVRQWLDFDSVLWGSYLSINPPRIWFNLEHPLNPNPENRKEPSPSERLDPFVGFYNWWPGMFVIEQDNPLDAYLALVIAITETMRTRRRRGIFLYHGWRYADELYLRRYETEELLTHIVTDTLFMLEEPIATGLIYPTAKTLLLDIAGRWVSEQMSEFRASYGDNHKLEFLERISEQCIRLHPHESYSYCRLAALQSAQGKIGEAKKTMRTALTKHQSLQTNDWAYLSSMAETQFAQSDKAMALSKAYVYASLAIASDAERDYVREELRKAFQGTVAFQLHAALDQSLTPQAQLLCELLQCEKPTQARNKSHQSTSRPEIHQVRFPRFIERLVRRILGVRPE